MIENAHFFRLVKHHHTIKDVVVGLFNPKVKIHHFIRYFNNNIYIKLNNLSQMTKKQL